MRVIVGDDLIFSLHNISNILKDLGHEVVGKATNAVEVVRLYRQLTPDFVMMDVRGMNSFYDEELKEIDTFDAVEIIKKFDSKSKIIVITATPETQFISSAFKKGADGVLVKGFNREKLQETVEKIFSKKKT